jgi:hypothetical protein
MATLRALGVVATHEDVDDLAGWAGASTDQDAVEDELSATT